MVRSTCPTIGRLAPGEVHVWLTNPDALHERKRWRRALLRTTLFAAAELRRLQNTPERRRRHLFFAVWTLKEAYIKARGLGLSLPLDGFSLDISAERPRIAFKDRCSDDASRWQFRRYAVTPGHVLALVLPTSGAALDVRLTWTVPDVAMDAGGP